MEAKVIRWGDDLAVRLTAEEAEQFGLSEGQTVEVKPKADPDVEAGARSVQILGGLRYENGLPAYTLAEMIAEMDRLGPAYCPDTVDWGPDVGAEIIDDEYSR